MSSKDSDDDSLLLAILGFALVLPSAAWSGFVLTKLWLWFVVPLGVGEIGTWQAAGLFLVGRWMGGTFNDKEDKRSGRGKLAYAILAGLLIPAMMWGFGAVYYALMT